MPDRLPSDEIEVLKGHVAALTHCLGFALVLLNRFSDNAVTDWLGGLSSVSDDDLRGEGVRDILDNLTEILERHTSRSLHGDDDT